MLNSLQYNSDSGRTLDALFLETGTGKEKHFLFNSFGLTPALKAKLLAQFLNKREEEYEKWQAAQAPKTLKVVPNRDSSLKLTDKLPKTDTSRSLSEPKKTQIDVNILVARPLKELSLHVRNLKLPSLALIVRCIKVLVLVIFSRHLCDHLLIKSGEKLIHNLTGRMSTDDVAHFKAKYPFMQACAYVLKSVPDSSSPQEVIDQKNLESRGYKIITPDAIRKFYELSYNIAITDKLKSNTIHDLFGSKRLSVS